MSALRTFLLFVWPSFVFFTIRRPFAGILAFLLQITLIGWPSTYKWAARALAQFDTREAVDQKAAELVRQLSPSSATLHDATGEAPAAEKRVSA